MKSRHFIPILIHIFLWGGLLYFAFVNFVQRTKWIKTSSDELLVFSREYNYVLLSCVVIDLISKGILFYLSVIFINERSDSTRTISKKNGVLAIVFVSTLAISLVICWLLIKKLDSEFLNRIQSLVIYIIMIHVLVFIAAIAWGIRLNLIEEIKAKQLLSEANLQAELGFLKWQINPHFLFNTLNNLFVESRKSNNPVLSEGIAKLSNIMRYMVREGSLEKVHLEKEIQYIKNYIDLELLRISSSDPVEIHTDFNIEDPSIEIAPFLILPLIENAFKHGINITKSSFIHVELTTTRSRLMLKVKNSNYGEGTSRVAEDKGIGLDNIRRRLSLIYPNKHRLNLYADEQVHIAELEIQFI